MQIAKPGPALMGESSSPSTAMGAGLNILPVRGIQKFLINSQALAEKQSMKTIFFTAVFLLIATSCSVTDTQRQVASSREDLEYRNSTAEIGELVSRDLKGSYFEVETTEKKAAEWNEKVLSYLDSIGKPGHTRGRIGAFDDRQIQEIYHRISTNVVADYSKVKNYDPDGHIGFCFGRAMNVYIEGLRMGLAKESIRKIWAVGSMKYNKIYWRYHVAGIVRRSDGQWMAIDPEYNRPITIQQWHKQVKAMDADGKLMIFTSAGKRFGPDSDEAASPGELDPTRHNPRARDAYNGYFKDLMRVSREEAAEVMRIRRENSAK